MEDYPEHYQRFGQTKGGDQRWRCRACAKTFSAGRPARRHKRSDKNSLVFKMLCNDLSIAKISKICELSYCDVYRRIDFFHDCVRSFVARCEDMARVDFNTVGSRFATDSQALTINWPTCFKRLSVVFQRLCTVHARSGFIIEAAFQFDPEISPQESENAVKAAGEDHLAIAFGQLGGI